MTMTMTMNIYTQTPDATHTREYWALRRDTLRTDLERAELWLAKEPDSELLLHQVELLHALIDVCDTRMVQFSNPISKML